VTIAVAEIALPDIGDSAGALISPQQEYRIGQAFYWRLQQSVDLIEDPEVNHYLSSLGYRLVSNSDSPTLKFNFFMVPDTSVNAFAAPGGFIGVNSGLMLTSQVEDELASVLAHEIAHITQRHLLRNFERAKQLSLPMTAAMIAAAVLGATDPNVGMAAMTAIQAGGVQMQLDFTRAHESEADNLGMATLARSGFDTHAMASFFERLQLTSRFYTGNAVPEFLRTHPVTLNRIADAKGRASSYVVKPQLEDKLQFYLMREKLRVMSSNNLAELLGFYEDALKTGRGNHSVATRYGYSRALMKVGEYTQARAILKPLIEQDHDRLSYQLLLAEIEENVGQVKRALAIYDELQKLYPDDQALSLMQVQTLIKANQPADAVEILQKQLDLGADNKKIIYQLLAKAKLAMGEKGESHSWFAEFYYTAGRLREAADQLRLAADFAKRDEYLLAKITARLREVENVMALMEEI
jgi:predicted Zn-dependent protease